MILELTATGDDYLAREPAQDEPWPESWRTLFRVLEKANQPLTQQQLQARWPPDLGKPDVATISRCLKRGMNDGRIERSGTGRRNEPYRYRVLP